MTTTFLRPDADEADGSWTNEAGNNTNLFASIDESSLNDSDFIKSIGDDDKVRFRLSDPGAALDSPTTIRYRCKSGTDTNVALVGRLYQGTGPGTLVAQWETGLTTSYATYTYDLSAAELALISNADDLYLEFEKAPQAPHLLSDIDLNFSDADYYESGNPAAVIGDFVSISRASTGYATNADGTLTSFGSNTLRITTNGLLVEDARTNYLWRSQEFDLLWGVGNITVTADQTAAPDGTTTADKFLISNTAAPYVRSHQDLTPANNTTSTFSVYVKQGTGTEWLLLESSDGSGVRWARQWFHLTGSGSLGANSSLDRISWVSASIEALANGWYRCVLSAQSTSGGDIYYQAINPVAADSSTTGSAVNDFIYAWGAQFEVGSFPSSYIPTTTTSATRAADLVTCIGNLDTVLSALPQSILVDCRSYVPSSQPRVISDSGSGVYLLSQQATGVIVYSFISSTTLDATLGNSLSFHTGDVKVALAQSASGRSLVGGGGTVTTDSVFGAATTAILGQDGWHGYYRRLTVYDTRLADATLQALTAP